jgi:hypothetical protein
MPHHSSHIRPFPGHFIPNKRLQFKYISPVFLLFSFDLGKPGRLIYNTGIKWGYGMNKLTYLLTVLVCLAFPFHVLAVADPIGHITAIEGQATATSVGAEARKLALKSDIFLNDRIITAKASKLQMVFKDESVLSQGETSEMTIDKYVYNPDAKNDVNASVKLAKGVFRVMTGKITDVNPDRFKVRTKMATIGIRGCELGFRIGSAKEDVYIIKLPKGKTIVIEKMIKDEVMSADIESRTRILNITKVGTAVLIQPGVDLRERAMTPIESKQLLQDSTPVISSSGGGAGGLLGNGSRMQASKDTVDQFVRMSSQTQNKKRLVSQLNTATKPLDQGTQNPLLPNITPPTSPPYVAAPTTLPPPAVGGSPMGDYEWSVWADGTIFISPNRAPAMAPTTPAAVLTANEYDIIAAAQTYDLTGSGDAAAVLNDPSGTKVVTGSCNPFYIHVASVAPSWNATFRLDYNKTDGIADGRNLLDFDANGTVASGQFTLSPANGITYYAMKINGNSYTAPTAASLTGSLIKPGQGPSPISAVIGQFAFQHGTAASARGAFGADFP